MRTNILAASFGSGQTTRTAALWQYDYGIMLKFNGLTLPAAYEVHFSNAQRGESVTQIGGADGVSIPDSLLQTGQTVYAWVYLHQGEDDGETCYMATIPVIGRAKPSDAEPTPVEQSAITEAIAALNAAVDEAESIRDAIPETVETALETAKESGEFDGADGRDGADGAPGRDGVDGVSPTASVTQTATGATVTVTDAQGTTTATLTNGQDGAPGQPGQDGADGISPTVTITEITGGHRITITDATGAHSADVMDGEGGVTDVQVNGTSVVSGGVANVPVASASALGVVSPTGALYINSNNKLAIDTGGDTQFKAGATLSAVVTPNSQHKSVFYGLAKAAGDSTQSASSNAVGQYTESAKSAIHTMLNGSVSVSGTTPVITAQAGIRYICGEVSTLDITLPASGCVDVVFESGSTPTVLTVTPPSGVTLKWAGGFDPSTLDADTTYEINVCDGLGVAGSWT